MTEDDDEELTYASVGVDIEASEQATAALVASVGAFDMDTYAGLLDIGDRYLGVATDGVGSKLLVAEAIERYNTIGIDCIAMNVNDLVAMGVTPLAFVDYLAVEAPDDEVAAAIGEGIAAGATAANIALLGGETAVLPEIISGFDLAGTCVGLATEEELLPGSAQPGDHLVGVPSSGIHSNGLTLARAAATKRHAYADPFPPAPDRSIGEELLTPTRIYADLLGPLRTHDVNGVAHITGGGWTNLHRLGEFEYVIDNPLPAQDVFGFIQAEGNVSDREMHRTFNMGTGLVAAVPPEAAEHLADSVSGQVIGTVTEGNGVKIRDLTL